MVQNGISKKITRPCSAGDWEACSKTFRKTNICSVVTSIAYGRLFM